MKLIDITGEKYGKLTVLKQNGGSSSGAKWECQCSCGTIKTIEGVNLKSGKTLSCGCYRIKRSQTHMMTNSKTYNTWANMIQRCTNKNKKDYKYYGGRGIFVCKQWLNSFEEFYKDMGEKPRSKTLDRIDNNKGYSPQNCKWATYKEQANNRRKRTEPKIYKKIGRNNKSKIIGVFWDKTNKNWVVNIRQKYLGTFKDLFSACCVRKKAEIEDIKGYRYETKTKN